VDAIRFVKQKIENLIVLQLLTAENSLLMITFAIKTALKTDKAESYLCSILVTAPFSEEAILLQENHSSDLRKLISLNTVEIDSAGDSITTLIGPVPDYKLLSCTLKLIYQGLYPLASDIVDHKLHLRIGGE